MEQVDETSYFQYLDHFNFRYLSGEGQSRFAGHLFAMDVFKFEFLISCLKTITPNSLIFKFYL